VPSSFALDSDDWMSTELYWYAAAPHYVEDYKSYGWLRDYKIYVWQPQIDVNIFPPHKAIIVLSGKTQESTLNRDTIILLRSHVEQAADLPTTFHKEWQLQMSKLPPTDIEMGISTLVLSLYNVILSDTKNFERDLLDQIAILVFRRILPRLLMN
jgi:hypothetical protein